MEAVSLILALAALLLAGAAYRRSKRNSLRYLQLLCRILVLKRNIMATKDEVAASNAALRQAIADLSARVDAIPPAAATAADLDVIKQGIDDSTAAVAAILPVSS